jgi:Spy/CpxP family protein refolding chaperone
MKKNLKTLAIIFSVVLNMVFIGSYFYHKVNPYPLTGHQVTHDRCLLEELNLSREQLDRFDPICDRFHVFLRQQGHAIKGKQLELIDLLARENPEREAIDTKQKEIQTLQRQMQKEVIGHLLEEIGTLMPAQRERFFALIKGRIEECDGSGPRWMPKARVNFSKGAR